jgi:hypothetical protein
MCSNLVTGLAENLDSFAGYMVSWMIYLPLGIITALYSNRKTTRERIVQFSVLMSFQHCIPCLVLIISAACYHVSCNRHTFQKVNNTIHINFSEHTSTRTFSATPYTVPIRWAPTIIGIRLASTTLNPSTSHTNRVPGSTTPPFSLFPIEAVQHGCW